MNIVPLFSYFLSFTGGAIGVLAFSPFDYPILAYLSLFVLLWVAKSPIKKTALWGSFFWGLGFFGIGISWLHVSIHQFGGASLPLSYTIVALFAGYLALYPVLFAYLVWRFHVQSPALYPVIWTLTELLRAKLFSGFPWLQFGYTQIDTPFFGIAPLFGVQGLTFFTMWVAGMLFYLYQLLRTTPRKWGVVALQSLLLAFVMGLAYCTTYFQFVKPNSEKTLNFALLQGNIAQQIKWDPAYLWHNLDTYDKLIQQYMGKADVIILPEVSLPLREAELLRFLQVINKQALANKTELLLGLVYETPQASLMNTIINLGNPLAPYHLGNQNRYNKHHLVPFGEYVPLEKILRPFGTIFNLPMSNFQAGTEKQANLQVQQHRIAPAICYEIIFGEQLRQNTHKNTDYLLTISNDAWFGDSIGPWQHLQMARMRALELGRPLIRATNNGITAFINEKGHILKLAPQFEQTSLTMALAPTTGQTPYAVLGSLPLYGLMAMLLFFHGIMAGLRKLLLTQAQNAP